MSDDLFVNHAHTNFDPNWLKNRPTTINMHDIVEIMRKWRDQEAFPLRIKRPPIAEEIAYSLDNVRKREVVLVISTRIANHLESVTSFEDRLHCTHTVVGVRHNPQLDLIGYDWILLDGEQVIGAGRSD